jgi:hypothetical protein
MNMPRTPVTTGKASLIGGLVVSVASIVLWLAVTGELGFHGPVNLGVGILVAIAAGMWTRLADL